MTRIAIQTFTLDADGNATEGELNTREEIADFLAEQPRDAAITGAFHVAVEIPLDRLRPKQDQPTHDWKHEGF